MRLLHKIKNKLVFTLASAGLKISLTLRQPMLTALVFWLLTGPFKRRQQYHVLCLGRSVFYDDIAALKKYSGRISYVAIHFVYWQVLYEHFTPNKQQRQQVTEFNYYTTDILKSEREHYRQYLSRFLPILQRWLGFQAILSGNIGYVTQQELAQAAAEHRIPLIILHKEALDVYGNYHYIAKDYRFVGAKVLFYNETIRDALLALPMAGLSLDKCAVVGIPRFDSYLRDQFVNDNRVKQIVFFAFYKSDRLTNLISDENKLAAVRQRYADFHKLVMSFAAHHPEINVIIKTKLSSHYYQYVTDIFNQNFTAPIRNLTITGIGNPKELIRQSIAVISASSTTAIEAVLGNRPLVSPYLADLVDDMSWDFFAKYPQLVHYVKTESELEQSIDSLGRAATDPVARARFLTEIMYKADGQASVRAETEIINVIKQYER